MIEVTSLRVRSLDLDFHEISWKLESSMEDVYDYTFEVLRSESPEGPFDLLTVPFQDRYVFVDNALQTAHKWRKWFYKVRVTYKPDGSQKDFGPADPSPEPDLIVAEIRRHMQLLFTEFAGRRVWILPLRTFGQRCECWDNVLSKRTRSGCVLCYDTGFIRGYMAPIEGYMQLDPSPKTQQVTNVGEQQQSDTTARMPHYPPLKPGDLVVEAENRRWRVTQAGQTEKGRAGSHQEVTMHEIPKRDVEYSIPLDMDEALRDLSISPARNFSNPHNFENYGDEEIRAIEDLYDRREF